MPAVVAVLLVAVVAVLAYPVLRPPFKESGVSTEVGPEVRPGDYAFAFPPFDNESAVTVTVTDMSIDQVPDGVTVLGYRLVDLGADGRGYRTSWSGSGPPFNLRSDPLFKPGARLIVPPFTKFRLFVMAEVRVTRIPTEPIGGCTVRYRALGRDRTQHLACTARFAPTAMP